MAQYPKPSSSSGTFNNNTFTNPDTGGLTIDEAKQYFVTFPVTQSPSTITANNLTTTGALNVAGDSQFGGDATFIGGATLTGPLSFSDNIILEGGVDITTLGTGITFPDNTTQTTAFIEDDYAQLNTDNIFLPTFTNTFQGTVDLGSSATALTQISGNSSTLLATTAFVQDSVFTYGVQTTDSPLYWFGANTNQYNSGLPENLAYSYPYGISNLWNLTAGGGDCDLICNSAVGANSSAFNIYCIQDNQTGTQLQSLTPQLSLSNNGTSAFLKDGLNVNNQNIINCNSITDTLGQFVTTTTPTFPSNNTTIATTEYVTTAIASEGFAVLNQGGTQNWVGNNTCSNGIWNYTNNSSVLVTTVANTTNNNTAASTAFVKANAGVYTQTSITSPANVYTTLTPSTVNVITTFTSASNTVSFNNVNFVITVVTVPTFILTQLNFSAPPFPGSPPANTTQNVSVFSNNGVTYSAQLSWLGPTSLLFSLPNTVYSGQTFTVNLSNIGAFIP